MPAFDFPLEKLRAYQGTNPRPPDHDAFWDRALEEMRGVDPRLEIRPAAFRTPAAECFDLYFTGVRGARIHAKYLRPWSADAPHPAVVRFHGYQGWAGDWRQHLDMASSGFSVFAMDCRGQGGESEDVGGVRGQTVGGQITRGIAGGASELLFRQIFLDAAQLAGIALAQPEVDPDRVASEGGSQGGALALVCAALEPRIRRVFSVHPFLCDYRRVWDLDLAANAYEDIRGWLRRFDPRHEHIDEFFTTLGYIDVQFLTPRIRGEVLMATGLMDTICPPSTQFAAYNRITAPKRMDIYPDYAHEHAPGLLDRGHEFLLGI